MEDDTLNGLLRDQQNLLPAHIDRTSMTPFRFKSLPIKDCDELNKLLSEIFDKEAQRLGMRAERFEYSCINEMYKPDHPLLETHYLLYDPGSPIYRGILGNLLGKHVKNIAGVDLGKLFEETTFTFSEVLFRLPGVDVGGYGNIHMFLNTINGRLRAHNLVVGYLRYEDLCSFRHGFDDLIGLIEGLPGTGLGSVTAGEVDLCPVLEEEEKKLYVVDVKGGRLISAPMATCNWNLNDFEGMDVEFMQQEYGDHIPVKDRQVNTFHFLNGVTPHYIREHLIDGLTRIRKYLNTDKNKQLPPHKIDRND